MYTLLGVANKELATEKEIKVAYKKSALKFHPDRLSGASEEKKKEAEENLSKSEMLLSYLAMLKGNVCMTRATIEMKLNN